MSGSAEEEEGDAARAFEALREEVLGLRKGIELVYRQGQEAKSVDYSLTLGQMAKTLQALQQGLTAIEGKPALGMTPEVYRERIEEAGRFAGQMAGRALSEGAAAQSAATRELREVTGRVRTAQGQRRWLLAVGAVGVLGGLMFWMVLVAALPWGGGTWLASLPLAGGDRWQAGQVLMQAGNPAGYERIVKLSQACGDQRVDYCTAAIVLKAVGSVGRDGTPPAGVRRDPRP
jgi:Family of unknown function (DUF6118)